MKMIQLTQAGQKIFVNPVEIVTISAASSGGGSAIGLSNGTVISVDQNQNTVMQLIGA